MLFALLVVHAPGCERGCLAQKLPDSGPLPLDLVDCPDGLARCRGGTLERSRLAQISAQSPAGCPWEAVGACDCVEDAVVGAEFATQLCRVDGGPWIEKRSPETAEACKAGARYACEAAQVIDCERQETVAVCTRDCAMRELEEDVAPRDAVTIVCRR